MKNIINKTTSVFLITLIIFSIFYSVFASNTNTLLEVVEKASKTEYLENNQGYISKTIIDSNANTGEVTIELKLSNTKNETSKSKNTEIILVIDNSGSMKFKTADGKTRKSILLDSAKNFVNSIFETSNNVKVGIVKFCGEYGFWAPANAASLITKPTEKEEDVIEGITKIEKISTESGTDIQKGLIKAENAFSKDAGNKVIILLTDGCPTEDASGNYLYNNEQVMTNEKYRKIIQNTKNELINIDKKGIKLISLMTGVNSNDLDENGNVVKNTEDEIQAIETIFGTESKPTAGKFYNVKTTDISNVVKNDITKDVQQILNTPINNVKIQDYFPQEIIDNFEFSYVENPNIGTVSKNINKDNSIEWNIGTIKGDETATLRYKLKIKNMENKQLLDKVISTNEKVILNYRDNNAKEYTLNLSTSPKIKLTEVKEELNATVTYNPKIETTKDVTVTIKTNKKVNKVDGWTLSEDGLTLTKVFSKNAKEVVHLVDLDNMKKDVEVVVNNIKSADINNSVNENTTTNNIISSKDTTIAKGRLPNTGISMKIIFIIVLILAFSLIVLRKYNNYKDI